MTALVVAGALVLAACGDDGGADPVAAAQARVTAAEKDLAEAQTAFTEASAAFCRDSADYIKAIDRYGGVFADTAATVGDVKTAGADLEAPRQAVKTRSEDALDAHGDVAKAETDLADAQADLAAVQSGGTRAPDASASTTTTTPLLPTATVARVEKAESDLKAVSQGITDQTPVAQAGVQFNAAAFALEVSWLRLFADAGCLTEEQQQQAVAAVTQYTATLQTALQGAGYFKGDIDGVYGASTVDAVKTLQTEAGLPVTGLVDRATATALEAAVLDAGGAVAAQALAHTAAVQSTLKLAGFWTGPVDGHWTPELTEALKAFQTKLGVQPTGAVDAATLSAIEKAIAEGRAATSTSSTSTTSSGSTTSTTSSAPTSTTSSSGTTTSTAASKTTTS
jgi:peptidoglycan hydrolase-like protein with peptidoglycan-binding domain